LIHRIENVIILNDCKIANQNYYILNPTNYQGGV